MTDTVKTLVFAAVAAVLAAAALFAVPRAPKPELFVDQGEEFYPEFKNANDAAALSIVEYFEQTGAVRAFKVELKDGKWVIPSHHNYPADAKDRMARTAKSVIDLRKDVYRGDRTQDHEEFGVVDPAEEKKGGGRRVTFHDRNGQVLADYIFGVETKDGSGLRYVRLPGQKRVYATRTPAEISGRFEDWIETDLLKLSSAAVRQVRFDNYSIDEVNGTLVNRREYILSRDDGAAPWKVTGMKDTEEPHGENVSTLVTALDDLKIVGVRLKPPGLTRALQAPEGSPMRLTVQDVRSLEARGYYIVRGQLLSNEGEIEACCEDGIVYTLRFGEILVGAGEALEVGTDDPKDRGDPKKDPKKEGSENRFLFTTCRFDESLLGAAPVDPGEFKKDPAWTDEQAKKEEEAHKAKKDDYDRKKKEYDGKVAAGRKRTQELSNRFADWYYVISADYFKKLRRSREELVRPKSAPPKPDDPHKHD